MTSHPSNLPSAFFLFCEAIVSSRSCKHVWTSSTPIPRSFINCAPHWIASLTFLVDLASEIIPMISSTLSINLVRFSLPSNPIFRYRACLRATCLSPTLFTNNAKLFLTSHYAFRWPQAFFSYWSLSNVQYRCNVLQSSCDTFDIGSAAKGIFTPSVRSSLSIRRYWAPLQFVKWFKTTSSS